MRHVSVKKTQRIISHQSDSKIKWEFKFTIVKQIIYIFGVVAHSHAVTVILFRVEGLRVGKPPTQEPRGSHPQPHDSEHVWCDKLK